MSDPIPVPAGPSRWRHPRSGALALSIAAVLSLVGGSSAVHALARPVSDVVLARASAAAVHGVVAAVWAQRDAATGAIYTRVVIDVQRAWGFAAAPPRVALKLLGGVVDGEALVVGGQARFTPGEEVVAFLDVRPRDRTLSVTGLERGKWTVRAGTAGPIASRHVHDRAAAEVVDAAALDALAALAGSRVALPAGLGAETDDALVPARDGTAAAPAAARWHEADWGAAVAVDSAYGGHPLFPSGGVTQFLRALAAWSAAGPLQLAPGVLRAPRCFANDEIADGRISVSYDDPCGEIADTSPLLAIGGAYYSSADVREVAGTPFWKITKGMVVLDNARPKFAGMSTGCYEELLTHELGHAIGLGHAVVSAAVMAPTLSPACVDRTESQPLQPADLTALAVPYPPVTDLPGPPPTPGGLSADVVGDHVTLRWLPAMGSASAAYRLEAGSLPGLADHGAFMLAATSFSVPRVAPGVYYVRVVAVNALGASAPSSDLVVIVGAGLPGLPTGIAAAGGPGGAVRIFWTPPAGSPASGYLLLAGNTRGAIAARIPLSGPSLVADHVSSGTYYVRVAAVNAAGVGPVSQEITVVVP